MSVKPQSISDRFILEAITKGYYSDNLGNVYGPAGNHIGATSPKKSGHLSVTLYVSGLNQRGFQAVLVHRFVAAYHYGPQALNSPCIRHLNDVPSDNRPENLCPGTYVENRRDIPKEKLSNMAKKQAHLLVSRSRKLSDKDVVELRKLREKTDTSYADLAQQFGVSTMTAYRAANNQSWKEIK